MTDNIESGGTHTPATERLSLVNWKMTRARFYFFFFSVGAWAEDMLGFRRTWLDLCVSCQA